ncbi:hypothetical protein PMAYCL1PPCAC_14272, partial [Pristionchus mayeri]
VWRRDGKREESRRRNRIHGGSRDHVLAIIGFDDHSFQCGTSRPESTVETVDRLECLLQLCPSRSLLLLFQSSSESEEFGQRTTKRNSGRIDNGFSKGLQAGCILVSREEEG